MKSQGRLLLLVIIVADILIVLAVVGLRLIKSRQAPSSSAQETSTPQTSPGLVVYGTVRNEGGAGISHVTIYRSYASYPGVEIAVTDSTGYFQSDFFAIPGDEMVSVWAEQAGLEFTPALCYWRHYYGYEMKSCNFEATTTKSLYLPVIIKAPK